MNIIEDLSINLFGKILLGERIPLAIVTISEPRVCLIPENHKITEKHLRRLAQNLTDFRTTSGDTPIDSKLREVSRDILARASRRLTVAVKSTKRTENTFADQIRRFIEHYDATTELMEKHLKPQLKALLPK